ncbi:MAG: hypothetical protein H6500_01270 [Candidatus Woesearchaeota archaeon]|nr:hypothetical protein [Nanoarchaeota archaeon]USN44460.1 MAG: hypothetical protein H6500_01270 [Candidatus Woesearchaeota archaeon]
MADKRREVFIRIQHLHQIIDTLKELKFHEEKVEKLFAEYDRLNSYEQKVFENWSNYLDDINERLDHVTL